MKESEIETEEAALEGPVLSPATRRLRAFARNRAALVGLVFVLLLCGGAVGAPLVATHSPSALADREARQPPSGRHWFGTDNVGRDVYSNVVYGARISLPIGLISVAIAASLGILVGGISGWKGGVWDTLLMAGIDVLLAFPSILLALLIVTMLGRGTWKVMVAVGISEVPRFARQMRAEVLALKEREFVLASRALGTRPMTILFGRILPNALGPLIVLATLGIATAVLEAAGLGFLGLGAEPSSPEWGTMLADNRDYLTTSWWLAVFPGLAISTTVLAFNLLGDGVRDAYDPRIASKGGT
jgi:ABC-type dipeptide/oligopeptide/nickel transport system permease subunit